MQVARSVVFVTNLDQAGEGSQLNRQRFAARLEMERAMRHKAMGCSSFTILMLSFLTCVGVYDPISMASAVHQQLGNRFDVSSLEDISSPRAIIEYIDTFIVVSREMSSAMVDVNTLDNIDPARCLDKHVHDICSLAYWRVPNNPWESDFVPRSNIFNDHLTPLNNPSIMECPSSHFANCINRSEPPHQDPNATHTTFGLTPEDPIIVKPRFKYPYQSVFVLSPVVWQTRAHKKPCAGFGDKYNEEVLGAGTCTADTECDPQIIKSRFDAGKENPSSDRVQTIFLTYKEDAFFCIDRGFEDEEFLDKSWYGQASHRDMTEGKPASRSTVRGRQVFYKFISDVAYIQAPPLDTIYIPNVPGANFDCSTPLCDSQTSETDQGCIDPLEFPDHHMWDTTYNKPCSLRKQWTQQYLDQPFSSRRNTFLTVETTSLTIAGLLITPQPDGIADITTFVEITFDIDQGGHIEASSSFTSVSETLALWLYIALFTWWWGLFHFLLTFWIVRKQYKAMKFSGERMDRLLIFDLVLCASCCTYISVNVSIEYSPPYILDDLMDALSQNSEETYFSVMSSIADYAGTLKSLKQFGYFLILGLFWRWNMFLTCHGKLAIMANTIQRAQDDILHFLMHLVSILSILGFLGHWSFGANDPNFATMKASIYKLFQILCGEFEFEEEVPSLDYIVYLVCVIFILTWVLLNFLMAIIIDAYEATKDLNSEMDVENDVLQDFIDALITMGVNSWYQWPNQAQVLKYLQSSEAPASADAEAPLAVVAEELYQNILTASGTRYFKNYQRASRYVDFYKQKRISQHGKFSLEERREECIVMLDKQMSVQAYGFKSISEYDGDFDVKFGDMDPESSGTLKTAKLAKQGSAMMVSGVGAIGAGLDQIMSKGDHALDIVFGDTERKDEDQENTQTQHERVSREQLHLVSDKLASDKHSGAAHEALNLMLPNILKEVEDIRTMITDIHGSAKKAEHAPPTSQKPKNAPPAPTPNVNAHLEADRTISEVSKLLDAHVVAVRQTLTESLSDRPENLENVGVKHAQASTTSKDANVLEDVGVQTGLTGSLMDAVTLMSDSLKSSESHWQLKQNASNDTSTFDEGQWQLEDPAKGKAEEPGFYACVSRVWGGQHCKPKGLPS